MSGILEFLLNLDKTVFHWINTGLSNPLFDAVLPLCRERWFWAPLYLFIGAFTFLNFGKTGWIIVLGLAFSAGLSDFTSSTLIKKNVQRVRPCNDPVMMASVHLRTHCGSGYSFTSSHASNHFAVAVFLIGMFGGISRWVRPAALFWAVTIAVSQVYVGVHYPGDVFCGALLGSAIGWWVLVTFRRLFKMNTNTQPGL